MKIQDTVIIGSGPAGLSAALYVLRAGFSVTVIGMNDGALAKADRIENYFGMPHPASGAELIEAGKRQVEHLGGTLLRDEVVGVSWNDTFTVMLSRGTLEAKTVIIATGSTRKTINIEGMEAFAGKGVSYCAVCDAFFYRDRAVAVLGSGEYALHEVTELIDIANCVTILTNGAEPTAAFPDKVSVLTAPVSRLEGADMLERVLLADGTVVPAEGLFVAIGTAGGSDLAQKLGLPLEDHKIVVDKDMCTMLPGVFAAGDCIGGIQQAATAVGEGATAAFSAIRFLRSKKQLQ